MRDRISWLVLATTSAVVVAFVVPLCLLVRTLAQDRAMNAADEGAGNVALVLAGLGGSPQLKHYLARLDVTRSPQIAVLTADGRSYGAAAGDLRRDPAVRRARTGEGFETRTGGGGAVFLPVVTPKGTAVVRATVSEQDMMRGVMPAWAGIITLGLVLLAAGWVIARRLGRRISEPLLHLADTAHQMREGDLDARAEVRGTPETEELARALNGLAERTRELLVAERASVGDLSHRLRTPVTALRLDVETVGDSKVAARLQHHIAVLQRTVDAIVKEARRPVRTDLAASCDAAGVVDDRARFWGALAEDGGRDLRLDLDPGPLRVPVAADDLRDVIDALVDNVFAHTAEGISFRLELGRVVGGVRLTVADEGPGWASEREERPGHTGLGLDIAARTARGCGGTFVRGLTETGGARVEVTLPLVTE
jgi:signal transduction histidine kinase